MFLSPTAYSQNHNNRTFGSEAQINNSLQFGNNDYSKAQPATTNKVKATTSSEDEEAPLKLYGVLAQRISWNDGVAPAANGMYSFDVVTDQSKLNIKPLFLDQRMIATNSGVYINGKYYLYYREVNSYGMLEKLTLLEFDADDGTVLKETVIEGASQSSVPYSLTYDSTTGTVYGYVQDRDENYMPIDILVKVNLEDGSVEKIGNLSDTFFALVFTQTGVLYGISDKGLLKSIDKKTAETTEIGNTGYQPLFHQSAAIDPKSGELYWAFYGWKVGKLLKVNLADATTTEICTFPDGENFIGLHSRTNYASDVAPGEITDIRIIFQQPGSKNATISCLAPTKKFDGTELTENVTVSLYVNDELVGTKENVAPGAVAEIPHTFQAEGPTRISVSASIDTEEGPKTTLETYVGLDTPQGVTNAVLELDQETGDYTLTWEAPSEIGANNGVINKANLRYRVIAYPSQKVIAEDLAETSISGTIEGNDLNNYFFGIIAKADGKESVEVESNRIKFGDAIRVPYNENFNNDLTWGIHTVKDGNNDGYSWTLADGRASYNGRQCPNQANDWLFTPPVKMRKDVKYTLYVTFDGGYWQTESFKVIASPGTDLTNPNIEVLYNKTEEFTYQQISVEYTPTKDGNFYFGFQCYSQAGIRGISIDSYNIVANGTPDAPGEVKNLTITPAENGINEATIRFNAPTTRLSGDPLEDGVMTQIAIYRGEQFEPIKIFNDPVKGQEYEYVDTEAVHGTNAYKVVTYSEEGNSYGVTSEAWVGEDYADAPTDFTAVINKEEKSVEFSWSKPTKSLHNGYLNEEDMTYTLMFIVPELTEDYVLIAENLKETTYVDTEATKYFIDMKDQYDIIFVVAAVTSAGMGKPASTSGSTGDAYGLPYWESFEGGYLTTAPWTYYVINETPKDCWLLVDDANSPFGITSYDSDNGLAMFYQETTYAEARLIGPRINLSGATQPILRFYMYHDVTVSANNWLQIEVRDEQNKDNFTNVGKPILVNNGKYGWTGHELSLEEFLSNNDFRVSYHGLAEKGVDFYIDNISIREAGEWEGYPAVSDLSVTRNSNNVAHLEWSEPSSTDFEIIGYDIYMDGVKQTKVAIPELSYDIQLEDNNAHTFTVKIVFYYGESVVSNEAQLGEVGIADNMDNMMLVYAADNQIIIQNCNGEHVKVYTIDGKQVLSTNISGNAAIEAEAGVYVVKAGERTYKVIVK